MGFLEGIQAGLNIKASGRAERQQELTALSQGYQLDPESGQYAPTENKKAKMDLESEQLKVTMDAVKSELSNLKAQQNADGITNTLANIMDNNWEDAAQNFSKIRESLKGAKGLNVSDISPINYNDPRDMQQLLDLGVDPEIVKTNPDVQDALNRTVIRVTGLDGATRLMPVDRIMKSTNTYNLMSKQQKDNYTTTARNVNSILKGVGILSSEETATAEKTAQATVTAQLEAQKASMMNEALKTGDIKEVMTTYMMLNPDKFIGKGGSERRDALAQAVEAFSKGNPNATEKEWQAFYSNYTMKTLEGVGGVREEHDIQQLSSAQSKAESFVEPSKAEARANETRIFAKLDDKKKRSVQEDVDRMKTNYHLTKNLDRILTTSADKLDRDVIATSKTWVEKKLGLETAQSFNNVDFDTRSGLLLANFIKEISGTAASNPEVMRLVNVLLGGNLTDEVYVRQAINSFADELKQQNIQISSTLGDSAPYSSRLYTTGFKEDEKPSTAKPGAKKPSAADFD